MCFATITSICSPIWQINQPYKSQAEKHGTKIYNLPASTANWASENWSLMQSVGNLEAL